MEERKTMSYKMTTEEEASYYALTKEEQVKFKEDLLTRKQKTTFMSAILNQLMLENIDDMERFGLTQGKIKRTVHTYKSQINAFLNKIFKMEEGGKRRISPVDMDILTNISAKVETLINEHYDEIKTV